MTHLQRDYTAYTPLWQCRHSDTPSLPCRAYGELRAEYDELELVGREVQEQRAQVQGRLRI